MFFSFFVSVFLFSKQLNQIEDNFYEKENLSVSYQNELVDAQEELLRSKKLAQSYIEEITSLLDYKKATELAVVKLQGDLEKLRQEYADLEGVVLKRTVEKLSKAENNIEY